MPFKVKPPLYHVWQSMRDRCNNPRNRQWKDYGGRGIKVCERWNSYSAFAEDMGERPDGYTLDREDNDGDYTPENCRWASRRDQQRNQRVTRVVTIEGISYKAVDLAERSGLKTDTILERAAQGLSLEEVLDPNKRVFAPGLALGGIANGRRQRAKTHCPKGHSYEDAITNKRGHRTCRQCFYAKERARRARKKAEAASFLT